MMGVLFDFVHLTSPFGWYSLSGLSDWRGDHALSTRHDLYTHAHGMSMNTSLIGEVIPATPEGEVSKK